MLAQMNNCPFCSSDKLDISIKTSGRWERYYHVAVYCKNCHCYGPRVIIRVDNYRKVTDDDKNIAIKLWNNANAKEKTNEKANNY